MKFKNDIEKFEFFESILKNEVSHATRIDFENELKNNSQLAEEFEEYKILSEVVIDNSILDIKSDLVSIHNNFSGNTGITSRNKKGLSNNNFITLFIGGIILISGILLIVKSKKEDSITKDTIENEQKIENAETKQEPEKIIQPAEEHIQEQIIEESKNNSKNDSEKTEIKEEKPEIENTVKQEAIALPEESVKDKIGTAEKIEKPVKTPDVNLAEETPVKEKNQINADEVVDCEKVMISCEFSSKETCVENYSGEIIVDKRSFTGGSPPYTLSINGGLDYYNSRYVFSLLKSGVYSLFVKDKNSCENEIASITIEEKICNTDYKYSPEFGELWTIPVEKNKVGIFRLFNKNGQILVEKDINEYSDNTWGGKDDGGVQLPMDYYPFVIQYSDGEVFKGSVTLVK